jgi:hypothetical protein
LSKFPSEIDTDSELPRIIDGVSETTGEAVNALREAVFAVENTLGTDIQGSADNLAERLNESLNPNGTIKTSALQASGLVGYPVTNADIATNAAVAESKLDLDYSTASLFSAITSNDVDIYSLQSTMTVVQATLTNHISGAADKHDGYDVVVSPALFGTNNVTDALYGISNRLETHRAATTPTEHLASAISYTPEDSSALTADNVQDAITQIDQGFLSSLTRHNSTAHSNGVSVPHVELLGGQAGTAGSSLRPTRLTSGSIEVIKSGLINSASLRSKGFSPSDFSASAQNFALTITTGSSSQSFTITNLHLASYPVAGRVSLRGVVQTLNNAFLAGQFLATAFEDEGELIIQHNISDSDCSLTVTTPASNSALSAMGLAGIVGDTIGSSTDKVFNVGGTVYEEVPTLLSSSVTQSSTSVSVNLGVDVGSSGLNLSAGNLLHVRDHSVSGNGTYVIQTVAASPGTTVTVNTAIPAGTANVLIYADTHSVSVGKNTTRLLVDENGLPVSSIKASLTVSQISGMVLTEVSPEFAASTATVALTKTGTTYSIVCTISSVAGQATTFEAGHIGYVKVWAPNNRDYLVYYVRDLAPTFPTTDTISVFDTEEEDFLLVGSVYNSGSSVEFPTDLRNVGLVGSSALGTEIGKGLIGENQATLRSSGVVRGFEVSTTTPTTTVVVDGGQAWVGPNYITKYRQNLVATNVATSAGTWNLVLTETGNYEIYAESGATTLENLLTRSDLIVLAQLTSSGSAISAVKDLRFFINHLDSRIPLTVDDRDLGAGNVRTFEAAAARSAASVSQPEIIVLTETTTSQDLDLVGSQVTAHADISITGDLTLSSGAKLVVNGDLTVTGDVTLTDAEIQVSGQFFCDQLTANSNVILAVGGAEVSSGIISGSNVLIYGLENSAATFELTDASVAGFTVTVMNLTVKNVEFVRTYSTLPAFSATGSNEAWIFQSVSFRQSQALTEAEALGANRSFIKLESGGSLDGLSLLECSGSNLGQILYSDGTLSRVRVRSGFYDQFGGLFTCASGSITDLSVEDGYFSGLAGTLLNLSFSATKARISLVNNFITDNFSGVVVGSASILKSDLSEIVGLNVASNHIQNVTTSQNLFGFAGASVVGSIDTNSFSSVATAAYLMSNTGGGSNIELHVDQNSVVDGTGGFFFGCRTSLSQNNVIMTGTSSVPIIDVSLSGTYTSSSALAYLSGNRIYATSGQEMNLVGVDAENNYFEAGTFTIDAVNLANNREFSVCRNHFRALNTSEDYAIETAILNAGSSDVSGQCRFQNNFVEGSPTLSLFYLNNSSSSGQVLIGGNVFNYEAPASGSAVVAIGQSGSDSGLNIVWVQDNFVFVNGGSIQYGILCKYSGTRILGNQFSSTGFSLGAVLLQSTVANAEVTGNVCRGSGTNAVISHASSTPTSVFIGRNKGVEERLEVSALGAREEGGWTVALADGYNYKNSSSGATLHIPLSGLPEGAQITGVEANVFCSGSVGTVRVELIQHIPVSGGLTGSIIASASNGSSGINQVISVGTSTFVRRDTSFSVKITCASTTGNKIGPIVVKTKL